MQQVKKTAIATALGAVVIGSLASINVQANTNPFSVNSLESGYMQVAPEGKCGGDKAEKAVKTMKEGKCGEGKCGGDKMKKAEKAVKTMKEGKCGEGKCGGDEMKKAEKAAKTMKEGKCGEGKCGGQA
jgi:uncharacterized low-complexity protein